MTTETVPSPVARAQASPVISLRGLTKDFPLGGLFARRSVRALDGVALDVRRGEIMALVGESGSGKSTIVRCLARLEKPTAGSMVVDGEDVLKTQPRHATRAYRGTVQMVFQDPFGSLNPVHPVSHFLERALRLHGVTRGQEETRAALDELMTTVGLSPELLSSYPHELSGGQRQRVAIARALAVEPKVVLADEPTSMLDVSVRVGILNLMRRLRDQRGLTILFITHDLASARYVADRTTVMFAGELVESGESLDLMARPSHPYTRLLLSAVPEPNRSTGYDPVERARLRSAVLESSTCPFDGDPDSPCSETEPVRHVVDAVTDHWVRCHRYRPSLEVARRALATDIARGTDAPDQDRGSR
ncbi:ABC transporter ATP-binding protein [Luteimicrobium xylanilyticum]|uniref:Oligopeptide transport ATP-binding protein OppF n=1 Tax=Luteimicrobium xylanilyticum TaxID=1133546 RepID=A0A5P9QB53_9MICO|nr:ATP-binding cassette domain-containing protein [Luteimicrobium xylanilyticum]QFU97665.1 Oligopeptide transport ATP-binding protein OppF [Luteimicrobium xylanilyticum]